MASQTTPGAWWRKQAIPVTTNPKIGYDVDPHRRDWEQRGRESGKESRDMEPVDQVSYFASSIVVEGCESTRSGMWERGESG